MHACQGQKVAEGYISRRPSVDAMSRPEGCRRRLQDDEGFSQCHDEARCCRRLQDQEVSSQRYDKAEGGKTE
eukprot:scaffold43247_cov19-Tisochrysis_lutea.AAC.2